MDKNQVSAMMNCSVDDNLNLKLSSNGDNNLSSNSIKAINSDYSCWDYWHHDYYPYYIKESYPVYIQERAQDKGKQAFEIIKMLKDSRFLKLETVGDFIDLMDKLIKIL